VVDLDRDTTAWVSPCDGLATSTEHCKDVEPKFIPPTWLKKRLRLREISGETHRR
jgi:hypothetical protein